MGSIREGMLVAQGHTEPKESRAEICMQADLQWPWTERQPALTLEAKTCSSRKMGPLLSRPVFFFWSQVHGCGCVASIVPLPEARLVYGGGRL